ncbi:MAG: DMT family transporter [Pseudomonadota bacterium]
MTRTHRPPLSLLLIALAAVVSMSAAPLLIKATDANEVTIGIVRLVVAVLAFSPALLLRRSLGKLSKWQWLQLCFIGFVFAAHWFTYFLSIKLATAALGALAITTYSVQYLVLAHLFNGESINGVEWLAIAVCFLGCLFVSPEWNLTDTTSQGILVGLFSALLYAALPLLHQRAQSVGTLERTWGQFFFALLFFAFAWGSADWDLTAGDWYCLLALGLLCTVIAHGLWVKASTELPAIYTSMIYYLYLPLALIGSVLFLHEDLTERKVLGTVLVISASASLSIYRYRRAH